MCRNEETARYLTQDKTQLIWKDVETNTGPLNYKVYLSESWFKFSK